jgi:hypothetical protein
MNTLNAQVNGLGSSDFLSPTLAAALLATAC